MIFRVRESNSEEANYRIYEEEEFGSRGVFDPNKNNVLINADDNAEYTVLEKVNEYVASDRLRVLCANVDTLTNKMDEFSVRVFSENPDVICLQEVLPKNAYGEIEVEIDLKINGYECLNQMR